MKDFISNNFYIEKETNVSQIDLAYKMTESVDKEYVEYVYRGNFSEKITESILGLTDAKFVNDKDVSGSRKKISSILIEALQNVIRHQDKSEDEDVDNKSLFVIQKTKDSIFISTGNVIENKNILELEQYLSEIKSHNNESLKKAYQKKMTDGIISEKGGGGLGIIGMARRTKGRVDYYFKKINDSYSYFYFQIRLVFSDTFKEVINDKLFNLKRISKFHDLLNEENILLNFNGSFAFENLTHLLPIIESHSIGGDKIKKKVFDFTVKALRNIIDFADKFEDEKGNTPKKRNSRGVFLLNKKGKKLYLTAGNLILNDKAIILGSKIRIINKTNPDGLIKIRDYIEQFYAFDVSKKPDLNLIDMKLKNDNNIYYLFKNINPKTSYFILQLVI